MKILYLSADRGIPIRGHKGAAVHVRMMCAAFRQLGHRVTILTPKPGPEDGPKPKAKIEKVRLVGQPEHYGDTFYEAAARKLAKGGYDLIYERFSLWSSAGARLRQEFDIPFVLELNAPLRLEAELYRELSDPELAQSIEKQQFSQADLIAAVSQPVAEYAIANGALAERVLLTPNGVDPAMFHPAVRGGRIHARYQLQEKFVVGFSGPIRPWHDIPTLLTAFGQLYQQDRSYHLLLVGQYPDELPDEISNEGLADAVTLTGPVDHREMPQHLAAMDVAIAPYAQLEQFYFSPLKLYEYLACGVPTVAANIGQIADCIQHEQNGLLYQPGDVKGLAKAINRLRNDNTWSRTLAWNGASQVLRERTWRQNASTLLSQLGSPPRNDTFTALPILDDNLRQRLYRATTPALATRLFKQQLPFYGELGPQRLKRVSQIELLKYKPRRRCVLGYTLQGRDKESGLRRYQRVVGKVFKDQRGQWLHDWQQQLVNNGFGAGSVDEIHMPRSLAYIPGMRMQVQEFALGQTLDQLALGENIARYIPRIGHALAKFHQSLPIMHQTNLKPLKQYGLAKELDSLAEIYGHLLDLRPGETAQLAAIYESLLFEAIRLPANAPSMLLHRDFYYSQVLLKHNAVTVIDIDLLAEGDPAIDVANFTAHMLYLGLEQRDNFEHFSVEAEQFMTAYSNYADVDEGFEHRVRFFERTTWFRLLRVVANRPDKSHLFNKLLPYLAANSVAENA